MLPSTLASLVLYNRSLKTIKTWIAIPCLRPSLRPLFLAGVQSISCSPKACSLWFEIGSAASLPALPGQVLSCEPGPDSLDLPSLHIRSGPVLLPMPTREVGRTELSWLQDTLGGITHAWALQPDRNPGPWLWPSATSDPRLLLGFWSLGWWMESASLRSLCARQGHGGCTIFLEADWFLFTRRKTQT